MVSTTTVAVCLIVHVLLIIQKSYGYPGEVVYGCSSDDTKIHLTFDDGPDINSNETAVILNILKEYNISATFFMIGDKVNRTNKSIELVQRMVDEGHTIGSHSWSHPNLIVQSFEEIKLQIDSATNILQSIIGYKPYVFRAPYGGLSDDVLSYLQSEGYTAVQWNMGNVDWYYGGNGDLMNEATMAQHPGSGGIITMHDRNQGKQNGDSLRHLIQILSNDTSYIPPFPVYNSPNFKIVSLLQCLSRNNINDMPKYHITENNNDDMLDAISVYWIGSVILTTCIVISCLIGFYSAKKKYKKSNEELEQTQLISRANRI